MKSEVTASWISGSQTSKTEYDVKDTEHPNNVLDMQVNCESENECVLLSVFFLFLIIFGIMRS